MSNLINNSVKWKLNRALKTKKVNQKNKFTFINSAAVKSHKIPEHYRRENEDFIKVTSPQRINYKAEVCAHIYDYKKDIKILDLCKILPGQPGIIEIK